MKRVLLLSFALIAWSVSGVYAQENQQPKEVVLYGEAFDQFPNVNPDRLEALLKDKEELDGISIYGAISEVCQQQGCWVKLFPINSSQKNGLMVKMKGHAYFVPKDAAGKRILVYGKVAKKEQSVKEQQHYLEDAGANQEEIDAIVNPKTVITFIASGVKIYQ